MLINEFTSKFAEQLDLDESKIVPELEFRTLPEWDSLAAITIITFVEDEFGIVMNDSAFKAARTVDDLFKLVTKTKG